MDFVLKYLLPILIPALLGVSLVPVMAFLKKLSAWVDNLPAWAQRAIVGLLAVGATQLGAVLGVPIPEDVLHMNGEAVTAILTALIAFLTHKLTKKA